MSDEFSQDDLQDGGEDPTLENDDYLADEEVSYKEYETSTNEAWRVDVWDKLSDDFDITLSEMRDWHDTYAGQGRTWTILRRYYYIAAIFIPESLKEVDHRRWTFKEIADEMSIPLRIVTEEFQKALDFWQKGKRTAKFTAKMASVRTSGEEEIHLPEQLDIYDDMSVDVIKSILTQIGYDHITDASHRLDIADRALTLKPYFEDRNRRPAARRIIGLEVSMHVYEAVLININNQMMREAKAEADFQANESNTGKNKFSDSHNKNLEDRLRNTEKALRDAAKAHTDLIQTLGIQDADEDHLKMVFTGALSSLIEACRAYENNEDNHLLDKVFTAKEIEWLLAPQGPRPSQYRMDIVLALGEDLKPENLYNPDYKPTKVTQKVSRKLQKIIKAYSDAAENDDGTIEGVDDASLDNDDAAPATLPEDPTIEAMASHTDQAGGVIKRPTMNRLDDDDDCIVSG